MCRSFLFFYLFFSLVSFSFAQTINFGPDLEDKLGFDFPKQEEWKEYYKTFHSSKIAYKSVEFDKFSRINVHFKLEKQQDISAFSFWIGEMSLDYKLINDSTFSLKLPPKKNNYELIAKFNKQTIAKISIKVFQTKKLQIVLIPVFSKSPNVNELEKKLNQIFNVAGIDVQLKTEQVFQPKVFKNTKTFTISDSTQRRFSSQMRLLRDLYFEQNKTKDPTKQYIFLVPSFSDSLLAHFSIKSKAVSFLNYKELSVKSIAQSICISKGFMDYSWENSGPEKGSTTNLMDVGIGENLVCFQWEKLQKGNFRSAFYDDDEFVKPKNGIVSYYFWKELKNGDIHIVNNDILASLQRPYKKNFISYRFGVSFQILKPFFKIQKFYFSWLNIFFSILLLVLFLFIRKKLHNYWSTKAKNRKFLKFFVKFSIFIGICFIFYESLILSNFILEKNKLVSGPIPEFNEVNYKQFKNQLLTDRRLVHQETQNVCSEILVEKDLHWDLRKRKKVLYFEVFVDKDGKFSNLKYYYNSDSLIVKSRQFAQKVNNHFIVVSVKNEVMNSEHQLVYDYYGKNVIDELQEDSPSKRILLFVNGYRPTSIGNSFEENFKDITKNGLEFPNSKNFIYDFDRHNYWEQWNQINLLFKNKLNPNETFYADGHFSVETSNFRSLLNFTNISSTYPKRCINPKKHTCEYMPTTSWKNNLFKSTKTTNVLKMLANKRGFNLRRNKGRIAGKNLLQNLNQLPSHSKNDTLFIVAHSMGFAYSLGIIDVLKGKINFGGYYILAPENAKSGKVESKEWKEIWQYGSDFNSATEDAPCLQDGIAPQSKVKGISSSRRVYIPKEFYARKGFFDSHFIGYYTWIFDLKPGNRGFISQH